MGYWLAACPGLATGARMGTAEVLLMLWLWLISSATAELLMPADAGCRVVFVSEVVVLLLLGASDMAVILTKLTGLT